MEDLLYVAITVALIAIGILFVIACNKIVGPDEQELAEESDLALSTEKLREKVST
ncbi:MAG TPA: hypothetical protein VEJ23_10230 [Solirubrobacteraceae bacterium]|nr:hypothetical protein [Solirubrobacteraceae bacterium]